MAATTAPSLVTVRRSNTPVKPGRMVNPQVQVEAPFRLNRKGRQVRALFILFTLIAVMFFAGQKVAHASSETVIVSVTVAPGESLWDIATQVNPAQDPRDTIAQIISLNELEGSDVEAGSSLMVPRY